MKGRLILAGAVGVAVVCAAGCSDAGPNTDAGRQHAAIIAKLKAVDQDIKSTTDVTTALGKYEVSIMEIQAFIEQFSETDEALELSKALSWVEGEKARLRIIQEANHPFPTPSPDLYK
ncbi:MAG: hypothetical protein HOK62_07435 [Verrucomicrobiales bacterium]|nr:hypothetical protein [Verrucomicrobiales bacterium]MBT6450535.1 hypothetical protein [Verrucomicrobiales bacterium]